MKKLLLLTSVSFLAAAPFTSAHANSDMTISTAGTSNITAGTAGGTTTYQGNNDTAILNNATLGGALDGGSTLVIIDGTNAGASAGTVTFNDAVTTSTGGAVTLRIRNESVLTTDADITASGTTILGIDLDAFNSVDINSTITTNGGDFDVEGVATFDSTGGTINLGTGNFIQSSTTTTTNLGALTAADIDLDSTNVSLGGTVTTSGTLTADVTTLTQSATINGTGGFTIAGGTATLNQNNSYTGATVIQSGGTLALDNYNAINPSSGVDVQAGGTLELVSDALTQEISGSGEIDLTNASLRSVNDSTSTFSGTLTGTNDLLTEGGGTMIFNSSNAAFAGRIGTLDGTVQLDAANVVGTSGAIFLQNGAHAEINADQNLSYIGSAGTAGTVELNANVTMQLASNVNVNTAFSGTGGLSINTPGGFTLDQTNTYTGDTSIVNGTLTIRNGSALADTNIVNISSDGTLNVQDSETVGQVIGSGEVRLIGTTTLTLGDASDFTSDVDISAFGTNNLIKQGTGTMNFTGSTAGNDLTLTVDGGSFLNNGLYQGNALINVSGTIGGTGTFQDNLTVNGTMAAGNSIGTLTVNGDYIQNGSATMEVEVNDAGQSDLLDVTGTVTLDGSVEFIFEAGAYSGTTDYTFITSGGGVTGTFAGSPTLTASPAGSNLYLTYNTNSVIATLVASGAYEDEASAENQEIAGVIDTARDSSELDEVNAALAPMTTAERNAALSNLAAGAQNANASIAVNSQHNGNMILSQRMQALTSGYTTASLSSPQQQLAALSSGANETGINAGGNMAAAQGAWMQAYGGFGEISGLDYDAAGVMAGYDRQIANDILIGANFGYANTDADGSNNLNFDADTYSVGLYSAYTPEQSVYIRGALGYSFSQTDTVRTVTATSDQASADYDSHAMTAYLESGYTFTETPAFPVDVTPSVSLSYVHLKEDGYTESGSSANLIVDDRETDSLEASLGIKLSKDIDYRSHNFVPEFSVAWSRELMDENTQSTARFAGSPASGSFTTLGNDTKEDRFRVGTGLTYEHDEQSSGFVRYQFSTNEDMDDHVLVAGFRYKW